MSDYNPDGYYIKDRIKWEYYKKNPKQYKRKKLCAWLYLLIPVCGIVGTSIVFDEMGLSIF